MISLGHWAFAFKEHMEAKYLLIVKVTAGLVILDKPIPRSKGAREVSSAAPAGTVLEAYRVVSVGGIPYAWLVPNPPIFLKPPYKTAWCRVRDADIEYVDVIELGTSDDASIAAAIIRLADAIHALVERSMNV